ETLVHKRRVDGGRDDDQRLDRLGPPVHEATDRDDAAPHNDENYSAERDAPHVVPFARCLTSCPSAAGRGPPGSRRERRRAAARRLQGLVRPWPLMARSP